MRLVDLLIVSSATGLAKDLIGSRPCQLKALDLVKCLKDRAPAQTKRKLFMRASINLCLVQGKCTPPSSSSKACVGEGVRAWLAPQLNACLETNGAEELLPDLLRRILPLTLSLPNTGNDTLEMDNNSSTPVTSTEVPTLQEALDEGFERSCVSPRSKLDFSLCLKRRMADLRSLEMKPVTRACFAELGEDCFKQLDDLKKVLCVCGQQISDDIELPSEQLSSNCSAPLYQVSMNQTMGRFCAEDPVEVESIRRYVLSRLRKGPKPIPD